MKLTLANIKELKRKSDSPLTKRVCNYVIDRWGDYDDKKYIFTDVLHYGCQSGVVGELIYYSDTVRFYKQYRQLVNVGKNHYCFSAFIKSAENKCIYISISDVRYFTNEWYEHILIRTAKDEQDYRGGFNHYTTLEALPTKAAELLDDLPF